MTSEEILHSQLVTNTGISGIVANRVWPDASPKKATLPCIVYARISTEFVRTIHTSAPVAEKVYFEIHCFADKRSEAEELAGVVYNELGSSDFQIVSQTSEKITDLDEDVELSILGLEYWHSFN
mgnify:CR=1 FL=1